jgi:hypothetical protein
MLLFQNLSGARLDGLLLVKAGLRVILLLPFLPRNVVIHYVE